MNRKDVWIQTCSGLPFHPWGDDPNEIRIKDIARALAKTDRWRGQFKDGVRHYSVGQHSILVSACLPPRAQLMGLLHDCGEFPFGDMPSPIKSHLPDFMEAEEHVIARVMSKYGVPNDRELRRLVKNADSYVGYREAQTLLTDFEFAWRGRDPVVPDQELDAHFSVLPWEATAVEEEFLKRFHKLTGNQYAE